jgi:tetratricopeptide (TPR) repeat protein
MKIWRSMVIAAVCAFGLGLGWTLTASAQEQTASVHGHVNNPAGQALTSGDVKFTKDKSAKPEDRKYTNSFPIDANGDYKGSDVAPGDYLALVMVEGKTPDFQEVTIKAGDNKQIDFDMSRPDYIAKMTPEERKTLEEYKAKNAQASQANKVIANLNTTIKAVRADMASPSPNFEKDQSDMKAAVDSKPDEGLLWITYGDTLQGGGDKAAAADRAAKKAPATDDAVMKQYTDAADAYKKGADLMAASKKPNPADQAIAYNQMGNALAKAGKTQDSSAAFENAAKLAPANAGMYYNNEAAVMFNAGQTDGALAAAEKAIAADPKRPDPYFIKGQVLIGKSTFDQKTQKIVPPAGTVDAYQQYLALAPDGKNAPAVKEVLASLGEKIDTKYSAHHK